MLLQYRNIAAAISIYIESHTMQGRANYH